MLVCNVNKGTLELRVVWLRGFMENFVDAESKFSSHLTLKVVFSASYSKSGRVNKPILFSRPSITRAEFSLRNQGTLLV